MSRLIQVHTLARDVLGCPRLRDIRTGEIYVDIGIPREEVGKL